MEQALRAATQPGDKVNFVRYADDFVVTGATRHLLEQKAQPALQRLDLMFVGIVGSPLCMIDPALSGSKDKDKNNSRSTSTSLCAGFRLPFAALRELRMTVVWVHQHP